MLRQIYLEINMNVVREILGMKESKLVPEEKIVQDPL